jgi:hypothetical protein
MSEVSSYLKRIADRVKYTRECFIESNLPTHISNIIAVPFYGDLPSTFLLSSFLLRQYKELNKNKYVILCSWPGYRDLFPYVDEYWSINDESVLKTLALGVNGFYNDSNLATELTRSILECFDIFTAKDMQRYYDKGFTDQYWNDFKQIKRFLPLIPAENKFHPNFTESLKSKTGRKIVIFPVTKMRSWQGKTMYLPVFKDFWIALCSRLLKEGFSPVILQNHFTYDLSPDFTNECTYLTAKNVGDIMAALRYCGLVLDIHSGISRIAIAARTPFLMIDERLRFIKEQDYIIDDLACEMPHQYIFSFSTMLMTGSVDNWNTSLLDQIIVRLGKMENYENTTSTGESYIAPPYDKVRKRKISRMGLKFIKKRV